MKPILRFNVSVQLGAFILTNQVQKNIKNYFYLPIALANYCNGKARLN